jgi:periplasmic protein TonB
MSQNNPSNKKSLILPIALGGILLAAGVFFVMGMMGSGAEDTATAEEAGIDSDAADAIANVTSRGSSAVAANTDVGALLEEARAARDKGQYIDPEGANEVELYLRVLELDPENRTAQEALLEVIPYAQDRVNQYIVEGNIPQAERALTLLRKADPNAVFLTSLAGKLENQKRLQASRQAEQQAAQLEQQRQFLQQQREQQAAARTPEATEPAAETPPPAAATSTAATRPAPATTPAATPPPTVAAATPTPSVATQTAPESRNFQLRRKVDPVYPQRALRQRLEGWVELSFVVTVDGNVTSVEVVNSQPKREFDREAIRALQQWKFSPRVENGKAVQATARQRLEFRLGS